MGDDAFSGQVVAISGAAGGIGGAAAGRFLASGARLVLIDRDAAALERLQDELGTAAQLVVCDQRDNAMIEAAVQQAGAVDIFVNGAGIILRRPLVEMAMDEIDDVLRVNLAGAIKMAVGIGRGMVARGRGTIVNLSSQHAFIGAGGRGIYAASKGGIAQFTRSAAVEWAPSGVRVVCLAPGPVASPMTAEARTSPDYVASVLARMPIARFLTSDEMAEIIWSLCRPEFASVVGATLLADGGASLS